MLNRMKKYMDEFMGEKNSFIELIVKRIVAGTRPEKILLFGSYVRGVPTEDSDLDILVIADIPAQKEKASKFMERLERRIKVLQLIRDINYQAPIDLIVYTPEEFKRVKRLNTSFIKEILKNGRVLYERKNQRVG